MSFAGRVKPFNVAKHLDNPEVIRAYVREVNAFMRKQAIEIERLQIENDELRSKFAFARHTALMCIYGHEESPE